MTYSKHEIEEFKRKIENDRTMRIEHEEITKRIERLHRENELDNLLPHWHERIENIDLSLQKHQIDERVIEDGIAILPNVDLRKLLRRLVSYQRKMFEEAILFNESLDKTNTCLIIDFWLKKKPLIPPTVIIFDQDYPDPAGIKLQNLNDDFHPIDGKHRLNVAVFCKVQTLPILVLKRQEEKILSLLK